MNNINPIIMDALLKNNNMVTTSQVQELGFSKQTLNNYVKAGLLERIRQGLYIKARCSYMVFPTGLRSCIQSPCPATRLYQVR